VDARAGTAALLAGALIALAGCASTRVGQLGRLPNDESLVTLVVTEDRQVVLDACHGGLAFGPVLGCQRSREVVLPGGQSVRTVTIVRYTDALPSALAFAIDLHELCHAIASLQAIADPCHEDGGLIREAASGRPPLR